jgi:hypothetical protein
VSATGKPGRSGTGGRLAFIAAIVAALAVTLMILQFRFDSLAPKFEHVDRVPTIEPNASRITAAPETEDAAEVVAPSSRSGVTYLTMPTARIAVLPARLEHEDAQARALLDSIRQALVIRLGSAPEVAELISLTEQQLAGMVPEAGATVPEDMRLYLAIVRRLGDVLVVEIAESSQPGSAHWSVGLRFNGPQTRAALSSVRVDRSGRSNADSERIAAKFAEEILDLTARSLLELAAGIVRAPLAEARTDREQLTALAALGPTGFDNDVLARAVSLGAGAVAAADRRSAWLLLRDRVYDPVLAESLSYALLSDPDASVREAAAETLGMYISAPSALAALEYAAANDASDAVRLTSQMASMNRDELASFALATLLDRSLAPEDRIAPMIQSGSRVLDDGLSRLYSPADIELAQALLEIVAASDDSAVRSQGLSQLQQLTLRAYASGGLAPELSTVLSEGLANPDMQTRLGVVRMLSILATVPEVRALLENVAEQDPQLADMLPYAFRYPGTSVVVP